MPADLTHFRDRLKASRRHLVERIAEEDDPSREIPDTFWLRTCADLQAVLEATEAVMAEHKGATADAP